MDSWASLVPQMVKNPPACGRHGFDPWVGKIPSRRAWQPTSSCLENPYGQRSLAGYNPWGHKESDMTEQLSTWIFECLKVKVKVKSPSRVRLFATPWTVAYQTPPSMGFSRQEYWSGLPFPSPGDLSNPGIKPGSPAFQADALTSEPPGKHLNAYLGFFFFFKPCHMACGILVPQAEIKS